MYIVTAIPPINQNAESMWAGLFILLLVFVIGGGAVCAWFVATHALKFFSDYQNTNKKQLEDNLKFFEKINTSQERIVIVLERLENNDSNQSEKLRDISDKVEDIDGLVVTLGVNVEKLQYEVERMQSGKVTSLNNRDDRKWGQSK